MTEVRVYVDDDRYGQADHVHLFIYPGAVVGVLLQGDEYVLKSSKDIMVRQIALSESEKSTDMSHAVRVLGDPEFNSGLRFNVQSEDECVLLVSERRSNETDEG